MALKLRIAAGECIVINGALIRAESKTEIMLMNRANFMMDRQIMRPEHANSPARRIYFSLQNLYLASVEEQEKMMEYFQEYSSQFHEATVNPAIKLSIDRMRERVAQGEFYEALGVARDLIQYEDTVFRQAPGDGEAAEV